MCRVFNYTEGACEDVTNNCDCPNTYAPVCSNGITYTNACEAECAGVINYENGACISICDLGSFTYTVNADGSYCFNENVALDNDVCAWTWNFGDGQSSNEMNPCNILLTPQADATVTPFTVCLTLSDCNQVEIGTCCQVIEVYNYNAVIFASACADLSNVDFGDCEAFLGYGMINNQCTGISGCSTFVNGVDYINAIYSDADMCQTACVTGGNENPNTDGSSGDTFTTLCIPTGGSAELCPMISIINQESIASYTCAYDNCAASAVSDDYCVNYQALAQTYQDTVYIQICNPNNECRTATYYITVGNDCPACTDEISVCTEAMTPLVLCPEFCDLSSDDDLEITFIQSFYTACSVHLLPENCLRYTPIPGFETYDVEDFLKVVACNAAGECDTVLYHIQVGGCDTFEAMPAFAENNDGGGAINEFGVIQLPADNDHKSGFNIYPNPARDTVDITLQMNNAAKQNISIQDLNGKLIAVYHIESDNTNPYLQMNTNGFAPGVYLVKWNNGTQQIVQKLLIEP
ncbi:MAG: T9SS type A sorting domain-containing protein [Sphingobacteriales bacterium]|nr:T9SS type A sorting domain-containing protein [Sphingobacteriales bacterium]